MKYMQLQISNSTVLFHVQQSIRKMALIKCSEYTVLYTECVHSFIVKLHMNLLRDRPQYAHSSSSMLQPDKFI